MKHTRIVGRFVRGLFFAAWQSVITWVVVIAAIAAVVALVASQFATIDALRTRNFQLGQTTTQASQRYDRLFDEYTKLYNESEQKGVNPSTTDPVDVPDKATTTTPGSVGATGAAGARGLQGLPGVRGQTGPAGPAGRDGRDGKNGAAGADSTVPGPTGATGSTGQAGADSTVPGPTGPTGATGAAGPAGATGAAGKDGVDGKPGADGRSVTSITCVSDGLTTSIVFYDQTGTEIGRVQSMCTPATAPAPTQ